ncbi:type 2 isopentenyl-diphosphate Delta-isomerase [Methanomicrobiaceae archaeon CYW5]|uniref:type 2 isopentenyl-diphosphate Delta-isomerase n=1 Tax=Methanovulcanius yangii TaxID=1789227 RepID=UPI0029C9DD0C|nr:type 2 isopentenyl-diphosphate Delta-isomerase [Methanovulcanius yangii]MBT8507474.1 type 2 isopentenyl-diphosphate Delta-isomerase [Methanovulcanius yangii]
MKNTSTSSRKKEHLIICANEPVLAGATGFDDIRLVHDALPECSMDAVDLRQRFLGHQLNSPLFIAAMTGGHPDTTAVNATLARAAEECGIGMGVGSQRAALEDPELEGSFTVVREEAPTAFLCANLGIIQLKDHGAEWADRAVEMIDAQALCIHLNPLQEAIQPEGDHDTSGCLESLRDLCSSARYPVIVKETGSGISYEVARSLYAAGAAAIDVGGIGGTSWAAVERVRAHDPALASLGDHFADWGIPTAVSVVETRRAGGPVIATGGLSRGTDIAKAIAIGADLGGMAHALLGPALDGDDALMSEISRIHRELAVAMYLTGARTVNELKSIRTYITGITAEMLRNEE